MPPHDMLHELSSRLDRAYEISRNIDDDEIKSHYVKYLCVLTSGYLEQSIKIVVRSYVITRTQPNITNYVLSSLNNLTNLKSEKIRDFLNTFNGDWKDKYESRITDEERDSINSVVANRHLIAHGQNTGISYVSISEWYKNIKTAVDKVQKIVNG